MNTKSKHNPMLPTYVGAGVGFIAFLVFGAIPGLLYGGYMGLIMTGALFGTPVEPTLFTRILTGGGMVLGLLASLFFFLVVGSILGTMVDLAYQALLRLLSGPAEVASKTEPATVKKDA